MTEGSRSELRTRSDHPRMSTYAKMRSWYSNGDSESGSSVEGIRGRLRKALEGSQPAWEGPFRASPTSHLDPVGLGGHAQRPFVASQSSAPSRPPSNQREPRLRLRDWAGER